MRVSSVVLLKRLGSVLIVALLAGCSSMPVGSILPLARINIETTALPDLRVAVRLPEGLRPQPGGVVLDAVIKLTGKPDRTESFLMVETEGAGDLAGLVSETREGFSLFAYRLAADDLPRFEALRQQITTARRAGQSGSLGFGIATREFCLTAGPVAGPILASTYLSTSETGQYVTASQDLDLRGQPEVAASLASLVACKS